MWSSFCATSSSSRSRWHVGRLRRRSPSSTVDVRRRRAGRSSSASGGRRVGHRGRRSAAPAPRCRGRRHALGVTAPARALRPCRPGTSTEFFRNGRLAASSRRRRRARQRATPGCAARRTGRRRGRRPGATPSSTARSAKLSAKRRHGAIGLRSGEQQHVVAVGIASDLDSSISGHEQPGVDAVAQLHRRAASPVVDERVAVEGGQRSGRRRPLDCVAAPRRRSRWRRSSRSA